CAVRGFVSGGEDARFARVELALDAFDDPVAGVGGHVAFECRDDDAPAGFGLAAAPAGQLEQAGSGEAARFNGDRPLAVHAHNPPPSSSNASTTVVRAARKRRRRSSAGAALPRSCPRARRASVSASCWRSVRWCMYPPRDSGFVFWWPGPVAGARPLAYDA